MENKKERVSSNTEEKKLSSRRDFMKKAAYSAPVLMAMGQLVKPTDTRADGTQSGISSPDPHPGWW